MGLLCEAEQTPVITDMNWIQTKNWAERVLSALRSEQPEVLLCSFAEVKLKPNQKPHSIDNSSYSVSLATKRRGEITEQL